MVTLEVRYDSMDNLLLRKVLDPSRPDHRQLLAGARSASEWPTRVCQLHVLSPTEAHDSHTCVHMLLKPEIATCSSDQIAPDHC